MNDLQGWLQHQLDTRNEKGGLRELQHANLKIDFVSNDYLGLARSSRNSPSSHQRLTRISTTIQWRHGVALAGWQQRVG